LRLAGRYQVAPSEIWPLTLGELAALFEGAAEGAWLRDRVGAAHAAITLNASSKNGGFRQEDFIGPLPTSLAGPAEDRPRFDDVVSAMRWGDLQQWLDELPDWAVED
jgi:hypothetical protein